MKIIKVVLGSALLALGAYLASMSQFGPDPLSFLWVGMTHKFSSISMGQANLISAFLMVILVLLYDRNHLHIGTILSPVVISIVFDLLLKTGFTPQSMLSRIITFIVGMIIYSFGIAVYLKQDLGKSPYDGAIASIMKIFNKPLSISKMGLDAGLYILAIVLGAPFVLGPIVFVIFSGALIQSFLELN